MPRYIKYWKERCQLRRCRIHEVSLATTVGDDKDNILGYSAAECGQIVQIFLSVTCCVRVCCERWVAAGLSVVGEVVVVVRDRGGTVTLRPSLDVTMVTRMSRHVTAHFAALPCSLQCRICHCCSLWPQIISLNLILSDLAVVLSRSYLNSLTPTILSRQTCSTTCATNTRNERNAVTLASAGSFNRHRTFGTRNHYC